MCKYLRMLGWDTLYSNQYMPEQLIAISKEENRILLSRSYGLTRHKDVTRSCWIRSPDPLEQVRDLAGRLDLSKSADPLVRCLNCNNRIERVDKQEVLHRLKPGTAQFFDEFFMCRACDQIYWEGSHYEHMRDFVRDLMRT